MLWPCKSPASVSEGLRQAAGFFLCFSAVVHSLQSLSAVVVHLALSPPFHLRQAGLYLSSKRNSRKPPNLYAFKRKLAKYKHLTSFLLHSKFATPVWPVSSFAFY